MINILSYMKTTQGRKSVIFYCVKSVRIQSFLVQIRENRDQKNSKYAFHVVFVSISYLKECIFNCTTLSIKVCESVSKACKNLFKFLEGTKSFTKICC